MCCVIETGKVYIRSYRREFGQAREGDERGTLLSVDLDYK